MLACSREHQLYFTLRVTNHGANVIAGGGGGLW